MNERLIQSGGECMNGALCVYLRVRWAGLSECVPTSLRENKSPYPALSPDESAIE